MVADFLLTIEGLGRVYRYAGDGRTVDGYVYWPGLDAGPLVVAPGADADVGLVLVAPDLHPHAPDLDTATARLDILDDDGTVRVVTSGRIVGVRSGGATEPIAFTVTRDAGGDAARGSAVPAPTAAVTAETWPVGAGEIGTSGGLYPVIFGYPGYADAEPPTPVVPVPMGEYTGTAGTTYLVVSEDPEAAIDTVEILNVATGGDGDETVSASEDDLGAALLRCDFSLSAGPLPTAPSHTFLAGYSPAGGGGVARGLYDAIRYVLRRWGGDSADLGRLSGVRDTLEPYEVDSWVVSRVEDPWALIEHWVSELPVAIRVSDRGRYLVPVRYRSDPRRVVGAITAPDDAARVSTFARENEPENVVTVRYRFGPAGAGAVLLAVGDLDDARPLAAGASAARYALAASSRARYGRRPGESIDLDWAWSSSTAAAVASARLDAYALPATIVTYALRGDVRAAEGDELEITDPDRSWVARRGILVEPPAEGLGGASITLRVP